MTFERDLSVIHYERVAYTYVDMLTETGGLSAFLSTAFYCIHITWNYSAFDNFMVSRLFKMKLAKEEIDLDSSYFDKSTYIRLGRFPYILVLCRRVFPKRCHEKCCKRSKREVAMKNARCKLEKEINIIAMVKSWRYFEIALHNLIPDSNQRYELKERARYITVNGESLEDENKTHVSTYALKHAKTIK